MKCDIEPEIYIIHLYLTRSRLASSYTKNKRSKEIKGLLWGYINYLKYYYTRIFLHRLLTLFLYVRYNTQTFFHVSLYLYTYIACIYILCTECRISLWNPRANVTTVRRSTFQHLIPQQELPT